MAKSEDFSEFFNPVPEFEPVHEETPYQRRIRLAKERKADQTWAQAVNEKLERFDALPYDDEMNYLYDEVKRLKWYIAGLATASSMYILGRWLRDRAN